MGKKGYKHSKESIEKMKGRKLSQETKDKIGAFHKGKIVSEETREKMRRAKINYIPWNKNLTNIYSEKTLKKMSDAQKRKPPSSQETRDKLSKAHKGKIKTPEHLAKIGAANRGPNNYNWKGGVKPYYPSEWGERLRKIIRNRDNNECQMCHKTNQKSKIEEGRALAIHHIDYNKKNCFSKNLIALCTSCHTRTTIGKIKNRKFWMNFFNRLYYINFY